jgi:hypothetical protein
MTSFFGPEIPAPFCVVSEQDFTEESFNDMLKYNEFRHKSMNKWNDYDRMDSINFEHQFCDLIGKYLEIDCNDDVLYMKAKGDKDLSSDTELCQNIFNQTNSFAKDWPRIIQKKFCVLKPIDVCEVRKNVEADADLDRLDKSSQEMFESFKCDWIVNTNKAKKYDKIIIKNCLKYFDNGQKFFCGFIMNHFKKQLQEKTSLLMIQRVSDLNTLPFYKQINQEWHEDDAKYVKFMHTMQNEFFNIKFDIENLKYMIDCKSTWYRHLKEKYPYPLNQNETIIKESSFSDEEIRHGIRELNESVFKYQQINNYIELNDRLMFIGAYHAISRERTLAERIKSQKQKQPYDKKIDLELTDQIKKLHMEITPDLRAILNEKGKGSFRK